MDTKDFEVYYNNFARLSKISVISLGAGCFAALFGKTLIFLPLWITGNVINAVAKNTLEKCINCSEYKDLRESYNYVLEHIVELSKTINFTSVEEVYALFEYLFFNNYLSFNKSDNKENINALPKESSIQAELVLNNHGVCRNKSYALANIYQKLDIEAGILPGTHIEPVLEINTTENLKINELLQQDPNEEVLMNIFNEILKEIYPALNNMDAYIKKTLKQNKHGNHAITVVNHDNKSYYFDPTLHYIFYEDPNDKNKLATPTGSLFFTSDKCKKYFNRCLNGYMESKYECADFHEVARNFEIAGEKILDYDETINNFHKDINPALETAENAFQSLRKSIR